MASQVSNLILFIGLTLIWQTKSLMASPCYPTDPTGNNPQNPCLQYPPPGIRSDSFAQGHARPVRELPSIRNTAGRILVGPAGYWTGSETKNNLRVVRTNKGKIFTFNSN